MQQLTLDQILFVPARLQPLKAAGPVAAADDRLAMLQLAVNGAPGLLVDARELNRPGPSYTVDTLRQLGTERPGDQLFLLLGADAARELPRWREAGEVSRRARIVVIPRKGSPPAPEGTITLHIRPPDISATAVRQAAARGESLQGLVPDEVARYIAAHGLYQTGV